MPVGFQQAAISIKPLISDLNSYRENLKVSKKNCRFIKNMTFWEESFQEKSNSFRKR